jgi:hypothetical protein
MMMKDTTTRPRKKNPLVGRYFILDGQICQVYGAVSASKFLCIIGIQPGKVVKELDEIVHLTFYDTESEAVRILRTSPIPEVISEVVAAPDIDADIDVGF